MTNTNTAIIAVAQSMQPYVVEVRRALHQHPEIRWEEKWTLAYIWDQLEDFKLDGLHIYQMKGGLIVDLTVDESTPARTLFRADVDALAVTEKTDLPFASQIPGMMHACGHDTHAAMLLGAIKAITEGKVKPTHNIRFVFQRAEENPLDLSGGHALVIDGVLRDVTEAHALHIWATGTTGSFIGRPGNMTCNSDRVKITVTCAGGHVGMPHIGENAISIGCDIVTSLRRFAARTVNANQAISLEPAVFNAGDAKKSNVMPSSVEIWTACRTYFLPKEQQAFHDKLKAHVTNVVAQYPGATVTTEIIPGHPVMTNSAGVYESDVALLKSAGQVTESMEPELGGEDYAWYGESQGGVPSCMWMLGANQPGTGGHHAPTFNPSEEVLWRGTLFWLLLATK